MATSKVCWCSTGYSAALFNRIFAADILNNFSPDDPAHRKLIEDVFLQERKLLKRGELPSDFKFIIAQKQA